MTYTFTIPVNPVAKGRPRFRKGKKPYTPTTTKTYEAHVAAAALEAKLPKMQGAIIIKAAFYVEPQRGGRADLDNYIKALLDGLKNHFNDNDVCGLNCTRIAVPKGEGKTNVEIGYIPDVMTVTAEEWSQRPEVFHKQRHNPKA